jgi:uncharacterized membrane protein
MSERGIFHLITRPVMTGILALLPIGFTVAIVAWLVDFAARLLGPGSSAGAIMKQVGWNIGESEFGAYLGGALFALLLVYLLGLLVEIGLKSRWERFTDGLSSRIPIIGTVYDASKRLVRLLERKESADVQSMKPVMCNFGGESGTGFPAFLPTGETFLFNGEEYHVVMIPTAPVPFGGAIMCVPKKCITRLDCGIEGLLNMYISMGTTVPEYMKGMAQVNQSSDKQIHG